MTNQERQDMIFETLYENMCKSKKIQTRRRIKTDKQLMDEYYDSVDNGVELYPEDRDIDIETDYYAIQALNGNL